LARRSTRFGCASRRSPPTIQNNRSAFFQHGKLLVLLDDRGDYWQCGFSSFPKAGSTGSKRAAAAISKRIVSFAGFLRDRVTELDDGSKIKLLTVQINRLRDWCRQGLLCIGDSAHAMSRRWRWYQSCHSGRVCDGELARGEMRSGSRYRERSAKSAGTARMADASDPAHAGGYSSTSSHRPGRLVAMARCRFCFVLLKWFPILRQVPARLIGLGRGPSIPPQSNRRMNQFTFLM